ncbi:MAG: decaprenyl-phosphate phosphoribosyltransferase [Pseudomonadota bacterium]|nr:MAG: decaprenyl-phosphate phosphoribosyltransferase [Pseudomonadota bacterium]
MSVGGEPERAPESHVTPSRLTVAAANDLEPRSEGPLSWRLAGVLRTLRPHQWHKNVFVLAPVVFAKEIFAVELLLRATSAVAIFCLLAGAVYTMNDLADVAADREHPLKRFRPIASGRVPVAWARWLAAGLVVLCLAGSAALGLRFLGILVAYFVLNVAYSFRLKHVAYVDVSCIAAGFVMRVMAGGYATNIAVSYYLLACTASLALFLGFGKRRHELSVAQARAGKQRAALESYSSRGLDFALAATGLITVALYLTYTLDPRTRAFFQSDWLWVSTVFVVLGILRFLTIVRDRPSAESPTQEIVRDGPFVAVILFWVGLVMWVVYHLRPT